MSGQEIYNLLELKEVALRPVIRNFIRLYEGPQITKGVDPSNISRKIVESAEKVSVLTLGDYSTYDIVTFTLYDKSYYSQVNCKFSFKENSDTRAILQFSHSDITVSLIIVPDGYQNVLFVNIESKYVNLHIGCTTNSIELLNISPDKLTTSVYMKTILTVIYQELKSAQLKDII